MVLKRHFCLQSLGSELGVTLSVVLASDASSAIAAAEKQGLMKFKHLALRYCFLKELAARSAVVSEKIPTRGNCADQLTKPLAEAAQLRSWSLLESVHLRPDTATE